MLLYHHRKLKIWTLVFHFFIIVGFGHGVLTLGILEILWFPYFNHAPNFGLNASFEQRLPVVGLCTLLGQVSIISSLFLQNTFLKNTILLAGIVLLWLSIIYYCYDTGAERNHVFAGLTALPFLATTLLTFLGHLLIRIRCWIKD